MALFFTILYSCPKSVILYSPLVFSIPSKRVLMQVLCESPVLRVLSWYLPLGKLGMQQISLENTWLTHTQKRQFHAAFTAQEREGGVP